MNTRKSEVRAILGQHRDSTPRARAVSFRLFQPARASVRSCARRRPASSRARSAPAGRLFPGSGADALRTSIAKACRALAIPLWSPHDLRHRRISLLHLRGTPWAVIGAFVGQRDLSTTADTYTHVLVDETELDYAELLAVSA